MTQSRCLALMAAAMMCAWGIGEGAHTAYAQSINIDIDTSAGVPGTGVPVSTFAGPASSAGPWNSNLAATTAPMTLTTVTGLTPGARLTRSFASGAVTSYGFNNAATSGAHEALLDDADSISPGAQVTYTIDRMTPGDYEVYTCGIAPDDATFRTTVNVAGAAEGAQTIGGTMPANAFALGITHARHTVTVGASGTIVITASSGATAGNYGTVNGIQVKLITPSRLYVRTRTGTGNGFTWPGAFGTVTEALDYAATHPSVREIWVAQGTHVPSTTWIAGDARSARFNLVNNVTMYGGFAGTEALLADRGDPALRPTILSGNIGTSANTDNTYNVVYADVASAKLDGFQISDAYNTLNECGTTCFQAYGGGVRHESGTLTLERCTISNNFAATSIAGFGGGIISRGTLRMSRCIIRDNQSRFGGGLSGGGNARIYNCRFYHNVATFAGGAMTIGNTGNLIVNCVFSGNQAWDGSEIQRGAAIYNGGQTAVINSTFVGNGGVDNAYVMTTNPFSPAGSQITLTNCIVWDNPTDSIYGMATVTNSDIQGGFAGSGNMNHDPYFWDSMGTDNVYGTLDDNVALRPNSPCIDAGTSSGAAADVMDLDSDGNVTELVPVDIGEGVRAFDDLGRANTGSGFVNYIDMGAYEFHGRSCPADINRDAVVDFFDYLDFVAAFAALDPEADYNGDGVVDFFDYLDFVNEFSTGC